MSSKLILEHLHLKHFATFDSTQMMFGPGLNCLVGETGSGKSLVMDALAIIFGGRADKKFIRKGSDFCLIEAVLSTNSLELINELDASGYPTENQKIYLKRIIYKNGTSKSYINQSHCSLTELSDFCRQHIDLVGQFENQQLLNENYLLTLVDRFGKHEALIDYKKIYSEWFHLKREIKHLEELNSTLIQKRDYLEFQINEILTLSPSLEDELKLIEKKDLIVNIEKYQLVKQNVMALIEGESGPKGLKDQWNLLKNLILKNPKFFQEQVTHKFLQIDLEFFELMHDLTKHELPDSTDEDIQETISRLDLYQRIKRKFGESVESVLQHLEQFETELNEISSVEDKLIATRNNFSIAEEKLEELARSLHTARLKTSHELSIALTQAVREMKMNGAEIKIVLNTLNDFNDWGKSSLLFLAQTNPGEGFHQIKDIASGGELSRILLAYRQVLAVHDSVSIFLFDEIDTGIGGETAHSIAKALKKVSLNSQIVAITHLPQIAIQADSVLEVSKEIKSEEGADRTESFVHQLTGSSIKSMAEKMVSLN
jgi:DNA repair protein RecN (Recombination protein N)